MYTNFEKEKIGKTFYFYKQQKNIKWDNLSKDTKCSKSIYSQLANGKIKKDKYYDTYLSYFNLIYKSTNNLQEWLESYLPRLNHALEVYDSNQIQDLNKEYKEYLEENKDYIIYHEYYLAFQHIFRYYHDNKYLTEQEVYEDILFIKNNLFEDTISIYLTEVMYISNNNSIGSIELLNKLYLLIKDSKSPILEHSLALYNKNMNNYECSLKIFKKLDEYWKNENNYYRQVKAKNGMFIIYKEIDKANAYKVSIDLINICNKFVIPNSLKKSINYNIGIYHYFDKRYDEAYELFYENVKKYQSDKEMILIGSICTKLGKTLPNEFIKLNFDYSPRKLYIDYFKKKKLGDNDQKLINYILNVLIPEELSNVIYVEPFWTIYENEMYTFFKNNKKYGKYYIQYKEMMNKICKY